MVRSLCINEDELFERLYFEFEDFLISWRLINTCLQGGTQEYNKIKLKILEMCRVYKEEMNRIERENKLKETYLTDEFVK